MRSYAPLSALISLALIGCSTSPLDPPPTASRFAGLWLVELPPHALYEATLYSFAPDGRVEELRTQVWGTGTPASFETGVVRNGNIQCEFGDHWSTTDDTLLRIEGDCSDAGVRVIELTANNAPSTNMDGLQISELRVDGELGWSGVELRKCQSESCFPEL